MKNMKEKNKQKRKKNKQIAPQPIKYQCAMTIRVS